MTTSGACLSIRGMRPLQPDARSSPLPALSFCVVEDTAVFLDLAGDRYFRLPHSCNAAFVAGLVNGVALAATMQAVGLDEFSVQAPVRATSDTLSPREPLDTRASLATPWLTFRALCEQRIAERRLAGRGLYNVLADLKHALCRPDITAPFDEAAAAIVKAFERAALFRSAVDRCLPRSIALARLLARSGYQCQVVLAVKLRPFAAHAWVQAGPLVLNESVEEAARYTPILIL